MVLLVLAAAWAAVLIPSALRARAEGRPGDSIGDFHRQLAGLHRSRPSSPQARLGYPRMAQGRVPQGPMSQGRIPQSLTSRVGADSYRHSAADTIPVKAGPSRSRTLKRRRDVLATLAIISVATLILGAFPVLRALWTVHLLVDIALIGYVALLLRLRNVSAETEMKVRFLPFAVPLDPMIEPAMLRQSVN